METLLNGRDILLRNISTLHLVHELEVALEVLIGRFYTYDYIGKFTASTRLFFIGFTQLHRFGDGFLVRHLWSALVSLYFKLTFQPVDNNFEVQFTHP